MIEKVHQLCIFFLMLTDFLETEGGRGKSLAQVYEIKA